MTLLRHEMIVRPDGAVSYLERLGHGLWTKEEATAWLGGGALEVWPTCQKEWVAVCREAAYIEGHKENEHASAFTKLRFYGAVVFLRRKSCAWLRRRR